MAVALRRGLAAVVGRRPRKASGGASPTGTERPDLASFKALSERLESGLERLRDLQWQLSDNEARYRDLLDSQADIIARLDTAGRLTFVNRAFCRTFGAEPGLVLGTVFRPVVLEREGPALIETTEPGRRQRYEELVGTADGPRWLAFERLAIADGDGRVCEVQLIGRDVTEERRSRAALAEARDQAEAANRAKSRFLAAMSHEIRTPMNGILGMTSLLEETELTAEQRSYLGAIDRSARNLLTIIDEILDLSKIEAGKLDIHTAAFPLDDCLQGVIELMGPRAREKGLELAWRLEPSLPRMVIGDETRVRQILLNLIGNAIKFTDRGSVVMRARRAAAAAGTGESGSDLAVEIAISDTGSGIAPDQIANLFTEFGQAEDMARRRREGTGLGLAISRRLARAMDGDIYVTSVPGEGATFVARLKLGVQAGARPVLALPAGAVGRRVLLVSERLEQRRVMQETLGSLGLEAQVATWARLDDDIAALPGQGAGIDAVVTDVEDGPEAVRRIRALLAAAAGRAPRMVLLVDHPGGSRLEAFRAAGSDAYLVRPVRPASLLAQLGLTAPAAGDGGGTDSVSEGAAVARSGAPRGRRVLLVEDNDINALLARRMAEKAGCVVQHAVSGGAALAWCAELLATAGALDLVLMDIHMPEMDGFETARRLKRLFAAHGRIAPAIVALTANAFAEDRKRCLEAGLDDYLAKPFDRAELEALLEKWCGSQGSAGGGPLAGFAA